MEHPLQQGIINLLEELRRYLRSQQELYGDEIYVRSAQPMVPEATAPSRRDTLLKFYYEVKDCQKCGLARHRTRLVFGSGNPNSSILLIGEAPGFHEDQQGKPFVGSAGQLLDRILAAINLSRQGIFITNVVKCRPPNNRDPLPEECEACSYILTRQIEIIEPKFILLLGRIAAGSLLKTDEPLTNLRGKVYQLRDAQAVVTYHPAALLRNPALKRGTWEDVQLFQKLFQGNS
ncbi:MAG: uracil-DNA glycosylase [candidate division KSB1 bacterium]|nr:uracil-DNA glycosylase [candidate division KSB1 bacterium]MDZ7333901.1 uracil-DNA glycosylase [candidate division KSB1 bacterium]MDZ7358346.1 uracil-DNA glycosylase [candidate division KSB1 bacterium]MDZ7399147.1 uracil-DNA glycosylase [candidate division KSB1 bacterium]